MQARNLLQRLDEIGGSLSESHRKIASFLVESGHNAAFMTAADIAASVKVSESTVVRFARILDFKGFPELQEFLRAGLLKSLSPADRLDMHRDIADEKQLAEHVAEMEVANIRAAFGQVDVRAMRTLAESICRARHCYVVGLRSSRSPATLLSHYLMKIVPQVRAITTSDLIFEELNWINDQDVLVAFSFPRYSKPAINAVRIAKKAGACTATITDSRTSPAALLSDHCLVSPVNSGFFGNSFAAAIAMSNLLLSFCTRVQPEAVHRNLDRIESAASKEQRFIDLSIRQDIDDAD